MANLSIASGVGIGIQAICLAAATLESHRAAMGRRLLLFFLIVTIKNDGSCTTCHRRSRHHLHLVFILRRIHHNPCCPVRRIMVIVRTLVLHVLGPLVPLSIVTGVSLTDIVPFVGSGIIFNSFVVAFFTTASASLCTSSMLVKFDRTSIVSSNFTRSLSEHPRKNALHPMPHGKGLGLEFMVRGRW